MSDSEIGGSLWVLLPRLALSVVVTVAFILFAFWEVFELSMFAYVFAGALAAFQTLMIYGLRQYKRATPIIADPPTDKPKH